MDLIRANDFDGFEVPPHFRNLPISPSHSISMAWCWGGHDSDLGTQQLCGCGISDPRCLYVIITASIVTFVYICCIAQVRPKSVCGHRVSNVMDLNGFDISIYLYIYIYILDGRYCGLLAADTTSKPHPDLWPGPVRKIVPTSMNCSQLTPVR